MVTYRATSPSDPVAAELLDEYFALREHGMPTYRTFRPDPAAFAPPAGEFLVATVDDDPVGCGGIKLLDPATAEVKHLYVRPAARGTGLGRALLGELERRAAVLGATTVVLDTNARLEAAQRLYRTSGYTEVPAYNENPNATHWFRKEL